MKAELLAVVGVVDARRLWWNELLAVVGVVDARRLWWNELLGLKMIDVY